MAWTIANETAGGGARGIAGTLWRALTDRLEGLGQWLAPLFLRLIMAWEFGEAGFEKLRGDNWFSHVQENFPFPFSVVSTDISWFMATWFEIVGAFALVLGLFTRFFAFSLLILTFVATAAVHWPDSWSSLGELWQGYAISDDGAGNFKLPLLFAVILVPLVLNGAGKLSLDHLLGRIRLPAPGTPRADGLSWSLAGVAFGLPLATLFPAFGLLLAAAGIAGFVVTWFRGGAHAA
ncbi:DoxX family protein [Wenzhouxiangella sp. XN24]|uniref:HvfX family Cu-binding RiPP maturation protein n=1 Tax=Wenzhouxiangella sp. XN24 TaxID=2713569 RepID=UPI0013EC9EC0|nr:DoxX family protein [Wenzhouxiangella sp. XN24]NGX17649.1 DoxX family protein [Wenzhouxiangella sp. XN24]